MTFRKKGLIAVLILVFALSSLAGCSKSGESNTSGNSNTSQKYVMKLGSVEPVEAVQHEATLRFKEAVEKATNGNVTIEVYPASQLGNARAEIEATQMNTQQGILMPNSNLVSFYPAASITDLPYLFPNREVAYKVMDGKVGEDYLNSYDKTGIHIISLWDGGFKQFTGNFIINSPADYKGKKIRVMENPVLIAQYKALGASAVPINFSETYNALQQNVVDGQENPMSSIYDMKFHEVQKCIAISDHGWLPLVLGVNKSWWDSLPAEYQKAIKTAADDNRDWLRTELTNQENTKYLPAFEKAGLTVVKLTQEQKDAFAAAIKEPTRTEAAKLLDDNGKALLKEIDDQVKQITGK